MSSPLVRTEGRECLPGALTQATPAHAVPSTRALAGAGTARCVVRAGSQQLPSRLWGLASPPRALTCAPAPDHRRGCLTWMVRGAHTHAWPCFGLGAARPTRQQESLLPSRGRSRLRVARRLRPASGQQALHPEARTTAWSLETKRCPKRGAQSLPDPRPRTQHLSAGTQPEALSPDLRIRASEQSPEPPGPCCGPQASVQSLQLITRAHSRPKHRIHSPG